MKYINIFKSTIELIQTTQITGILLIFLFFLDMLDMYGKTETQNDENLLDDILKPTEIDTKLNTKLNADNNVDDADKKDKVKSSSSSKSSLFLTQLNEKYDFDNKIHQHLTDKNFNEAIKLQKKIMTKCEQHMIQYRDGKLFLGTDEVRDIPADISQITKEYELFVDELKIMREANNSIEYTQKLMYKQKWQDWKLYGFDAGVILVNDPYFKAFMVWVALIITSKWFFF